MRRSTSSWLAVLWLALAAVGAAAQDAVVTRSVNLRDGPASSGTTVIRSLSLGDELTLLDFTPTNRYYRVRTSAGEPGWVYGPFIRILGATDRPPEVYRDCAPEGNALQESRRARNRLKNRVTTPAAADVDAATTLAALLQPGNDSSRWSDGRAARVTGFVFDVKPGGQETVNCGETDVRFKDTHIEVVLAPGDTTKARRVIVEVTPRWRAYMQTRGADWSTATLRTTLEGRWVQFTGWLFFDAEHGDESENTRPGGANNWRATAWEIHPVTAIAVVAPPP
jgi:hypothetical protein